MSNYSSAVGVFDSHAGAEEAIKQLQKSGFKISNVSLVGMDSHTDEQVVGYYNAGDRMKYWGKQGAFWGGLWGLLMGAGFFWVPTVGPLLVAGPLVAMIAGALEGAVIVGGLSALGAGLYSLGIPKDSILEYETAIKNGQYLLIYHGTPMEVEKARLILGETKVLQTRAHTKSANRGSTKGTPVHA